MFCFRYNFLIIFIFITSQTSGAEQINVKTSSLSSSRQKRFVLFPEGASRIQVICGAGVPVDLRRETVILGTLIKANYKLPSNISQVSYSATLYGKRRKRSLSRWQIYGMLSQMAEMYGLGGKPCILKSICEAARHPMDQSFSLFDELMHLVFTPTTTKEALNHHTDNEYFAAQAAGMNLADCDLFFPDCERSLVGELTHLGNEVW